MWDNDHACVFQFQKSDGGQQGFRFATPPGCIASHHAKIANGVLGAPGASAGGGGQQEVILSMAVNQPVPSCSKLPGRNCNTSTGQAVMCPVAKDQDICGCIGATKACKPCRDCKLCTHGAPTGGENVHKTGWMSARCTLIDMEDGGMYVRGHADGRSHPMDFAPHEYLALAAAWVVRSAIVTFAQDGSRHLTPGIPIAPNAKPHYYGYWMRDGFYGSQLIASLNGSITVVNSSMARQFISSYEWMWARPSGCKLPGCEGATQPIPEGIFPQACTLPLPPAPQVPHCDYGQGGAPNLDLDTCSFAVKSLHVAYKVLGGDQRSAESAAFFNKYKAAMVKSLAMTTKDPDGSGLLWSNTSAPMVGYGFQDAETKSGCVFYSSVLYWNATRQMAEMATETGDYKLATSMQAEAERVRKAATEILWNDKLGVFMASTGLEKLNVDIWGNAMAGAMGFTTPAQDAKMFKYFQVNEENIFYEGQVREVPFPTQWTDTSTGDGLDPNSPSDPGATRRIYQNGGYWATPHHHVLPWLGQHSKAMACRLLNDTAKSYRSHGIWEWVGPFFPALAFGAPGYTASAADTYFASEQLRCWE